MECSEEKENLTETKTSGEGGPPTWLGRCAGRKVMPKLRPSDLKICDITVTTMKQEGWGEALTLHWSRLCLSLYLPTLTAKKGT